MTIGRVFSTGGEPRQVMLLVGERLCPATVPGSVPMPPQGALVTFTHRQGRMEVRGLAEGAMPRAAETTAWSEGGDALRWRAPGGGMPSRMTLLRLRAVVLRGIREWFHQQDFLETDTPALLRAPSPEAVFEPIQAGEGWLGTSPEFQLKRMLVGGFERIYRMGPVFRGAEVGPHHNPEFTLLEWYRVDAGLEAMAADLEGLLGHLAPMARTFLEDDALAGAGSVPGEHMVRLRALEGAPFARATVAKLFAVHLKMNLSGVETVEALRQAAQEAGREAPAGEDFTALFSRLWLDVEAEFPDAPLLVVDWPAPTASLARLKPGDPTVAERMELYAGGLELANGFAELTDPAEQRARFERDLAQRAEQGLRTVPLDEPFLGALEEGMPPAAGMALGVDRLVMLLSGADRIRNVLPFAWDEL